MVSGKKPRLLIVDDEKVICDLLYDELTDLGYLCSRALNGNEALTKLVTRDFDVTLLDIKLPGMSGIDVLKKLQTNHPNTAVIMVTGVNDIEVAVDTMKLGASDYIVKPFTLNRVNTSICTVLEAKKTLQERKDYETPLRKEEDKQSKEASFDEMDAIARGVEVRLDSLFNYSKIVTRETIDIARQLDVPDKNIQRWAAIRLRRDAERNTAIESSLIKLERSLPAQPIMDITESYLYRPKHDKSQN